MTTLPSPRTLIEFIATRDHTSLQPKAGDTAEEARIKKLSLQQAQEYLDFYVNKMVPAVAGCKLWGPAVRHHEPMISSKIPNTEGELRITASTEAFVFTLYKNGWKKWQSTLKWEQTRANKSQKMPKYNPKKPEEHKEFSTPFTNGNCGQQKYGGWNTEGKAYYTKLQKIIAESRKENYDRHLEVDTACAARLKAAHSSLYPDEDEDEGQSKGKKRKAPTGDDDEDEHDCDDGGEGIEWYEE
jgi:hypothetical protein